MARDVFVNGEAMISVKGYSGSAIGSLTQLGLAQNGISIRLNFKHRDINVDSWGPEVPVDVQCFLADATVQMQLVHVDRTVLDVVLGHSMGIAATSGVVGQLPHAGQRMGQGSISSPPTARFGNNYIGLNISSPIAGKPWRFFYTYLTGTPFEQPIGTERSIFTLNWRAIPYTNDPWGGGSAQTGTSAGNGALGAWLFDSTLDT